jgi:hypothetical protein
MSAASEKGAASEQDVQAVAKRARCARNRARKALEISGSLEDAIEIAKKEVSDRAAAPAPPAAAFASLAAPAKRVTSVEGVSFEDMTIQDALVNMIGDQNTTHQRDFATLLLPTNDPIRRAAPGFTKVVCAYGWLGGKGISRKEGYARDPDGTRSRSEDGMIWAVPGETLIKRPWQTWVHFFAENPESPDMPWTVFGSQYFQGVNPEEIEVKECNEDSEEDSEEDD